MKRPATPAQLRFFLLDEQEGRPTLVQHVSVSTPASAQRLADAARSVIAAHPALRTSLHPEPEGLMQLVHPPTDVDITVHPQVTDAQESAAAFRAAYRRVGAPFDHQGGPLCRVEIVPCADQVHCLFGVHHAIFDDGSAGVLLSALMTTYERGTAPAVQAPSPVPATSPERIAVLEEFWASALSDCPPDTALPQLGRSRDRSRGAATTVLDADLVAAMHQCAQETGATAFTQFMAALAWVTGWYLRSDDVVFATAASNARDTTGAQVIDCLQNTIPVRIRTAEATTVQLLDRTLDALFDAVEHSELPIEQILTVTGADRRPGRKPFTQIMCTQGQLYTELLSPSGQTWRLDPPRADEVEYDLSATLLTDPQGGLRITVAYPEPALDGRVAHRLLGHLVRALRELSSGQVRALTEIDLLGAEELAELAALSGAPLAPTQPAVPVHELVAAQARRTPEALAVTAGPGPDGATPAERLDYATLQARATALGAALIEAGVRPGGRVGVCLARTTSLPVAVLAVWKTGAAYVPLDPDYPADRLRYMIDDAAPTAVVCDRPMDLDVPTLHPEAEGDPAAVHWPEVAADAPAYVMYTSGSTGRPKSTVVRHDNLRSLFAALDQWLGGTPEAFAAATSLSFDVSVTELYWPLVRGRAVYLTSHRTIAQDGGVPEGALYQCTPTVARLHLASADGRRLLGRLSGVMVGGEPLTADLAAELDVLVPGPVINGYGPTEAAVYTTLWRVAPGVPVHIGHPIAGVDCRVVDDHGRLLPPGCPGELLISGAGVGDGYWRRPELTAERFVPLEPTSAAHATHATRAARDGKAVAYRTGDVVVFTPDQGLRFLARADNQIKVLGQRIEAEEIELALRSHVQVRHAAVTTLAGGAGVAAYLVLTEPGGTPDDDPTDTLTDDPTDAPPALVTELRTHAARWLTGAMVPAVWQIVPELPQLPNGKLDRGSLAEWAAAAGSGAPAPSTAPGESSTAAGIVRALWEQVLGAPLTDWDATFFQLGGSSGDVLRILTQLRDGFPGLQAADLFRHTTARGLTAHLTALREAGPDTGATTDGTAADPASTDPGRGAQRARTSGDWGTTHGRH